MYIHTCWIACMHTCRCTYTVAYTCINTHILTSRCVHICMVSVYVDEYIYIYTYTYICVRECAPKGMLWKSQHKSLTRPCTYPSLNSSQSLSTNTSCLLHLKDRLNSLCATAWLGIGSPTLGVHSGHQRAWLGIDVSHFGGPLWAPSRARLRLGAGYAAAVASPWARRAVALVQSRTVWSAGSECASVRA